MKLNTLYDNDGRIIAAVVDDGTYDGPRPVPDKNSYVGVFEVPATKGKLSLEEVCKGLKVDMKAQRLIQR